MKFKRTISFLLSVFMIVSFCGYFSNEVAICNPTLNANAANVEDIVARADYLYGIKWTPLKTINAFNEKFVKGETYHIPYGMPVSSNTFIGYNISVTDFVKETKKSDSKLYTNYASYNGWCSPYYSMDCSTFVSYCWGLKNRQTTDTLGKYGKNLGACNSTNVSKIKIGDALNSETSANGHVKLVTGISNGKYEITEQTPDQLKRQTYTASELVSLNGGYYILRPTGFTTNTVTIHYNANGGTLASDSDYYIGNNNDIYRKSDKKLMGPTWENGYKDPNGLVNASTIKLSKTGYTFLGWSLQKSGGKIYDQNDSSVSANDLFPDVKNKSDTIMLYAQWEKNIVTIHYNANGGTLASDSDYYIGNNNDIYRKSDKKLMGPTWENGYKDPNGLVNASTIKLSKSGYTFLGWSLQKSGGKIYDQNDSSVSANDLFPDVKNKSGTIMLYAQWGGQMMKESEGAGQTIPDGDYWIVNGLCTHYMVDIPGDNFNTSNGTNLKMQMWSNNDFGEYDVFTLKYLNNGFYSITQRNTNMTANVSEKSLLNGSNVHMWEKNNSEASQWSIRKTNNGYTLQSRCNSFYLDVEGGKTDNCNLQVYEGNGTKSQLFSFIPYNAGQVIQDGVYRIGTSRGKGAYIDAEGEPGEYNDKTNIQIWDAGADNYFRLEYCNNGFYKIYDNVSGLALDVYNPDKNDYLGKGTNVQLYKNKDTLGQYWAIKPAGNGYYYIISKLNGYCLDLNRGNTENGTNIQIWYDFGDNQKWSFVTNKELSVTAPNNTVYYVGEKLDTSGMVAKMIYSDGYSMDVTKNVKISCNMSIVGTQNVIVTYEQGGLKNTAKFAITIKEKGVITSIPENTTIQTSTTAKSATTTKKTTTTTVKPKITTTKPTATTESTIKITLAGDANCDGRVSIADATAILQSLGNNDKYGLTPQGTMNADVNGKAGITVDDAIVIKSVDAGLINASNLPLKL